MPEVFANIPDSCRSQEAHGEMRREGTPVKTMTEVVADKLAALDELTDGDGFTYSWFDMERADLARELAEALAAAGYGPVRGMRTVLADREAELLNLKGPCRAPGCRLHYAHRGPCNTSEATP